MCRLVSGMTVPLRQLHLSGPDWGHVCCDTLRDELHKHWFSPTLLQLARSRDAATSSEDGGAEHQ